jgi:HlyD family secretion protein
MSKKKWILPLIALIGISAAVFYVSTTTPPPPVAKPVNEPSKIPFAQYIGGAGLTEPNSENIAIGSEMAGVVREINVTVGDTVKAGDILFVLDNREAEANLAQAKAQLLQAKADQQNRQDQYNIVASVKDKRAISKDERDQRRNALVGAKANVEAAAAAVNAAQVMLDLHSVVSPIDGVVMTKNIRAGEFAPAGMVADPLIRLGNVNPMHIRVDIDENDAWRFKPGARAIAYVRGNNDIAVELAFVRVEPYVRPKRSLTGDSTERVDTRVLQIIYAFDPTGKPIYPGQQMDVYIEVK